MSVRPKMTGAARVVAWMYAVFGALLALGEVVLLAGREDPTGQIVYALVASILFVVSGVGILARAEWAWWIAVGLAVFYLLMSPVVAVDELIGGIITAAIAILALAGLVLRRRGPAPKEGLVPRPPAGGVPLPPPPDAGPDRLG